MSEEAPTFCWRPMEAALPFLRCLEFLVDKNRGGPSTWGPVLVWDAGDKNRAAGPVWANVIDWGDDNRNTHWRAVVDYDGDQVIKPIAWMRLTPPVDDTTARGQTEPVHNPPAEPLP